MPETPADSRVFRNEVHSLFLRPFIDDAVEKLGRGRVAEILTALGAEEAQLLDQTAWVSLQFCEGLFEGLARAVDDPAMFERCGRMAVSPRYAGILRPLFRAFGSPLFAFKQVVQATGRFNKIGEMTVREARPGFVAIEYRSRPGAPTERAPLVCQARAAQLGALPTMFDLAPGEVSHPVCLHRGGSVCRYDIAWKEYGGRFNWRPTFLVGAGLGATAGLTLAARGWVLAGITTLVAVVAAALSKMAELRRTVAGQAADLADTHDALARSARFHELRFAQLTEAKAGVERKVDERTSELRDVNRRLESALHELRALEEAERTFFANISHDLRTPLTLILTPLEDMLDDVQLPAATRRAAETMHRNAQQLRRLIDQLLDLEKIQAGRFELVPTTLDMRALVESTVDKFQAEAQRRGIRLRAIQPATPQMVTVDLAWTDSVLMNVLSNAMKFATSAIVLRLSDGEGPVALHIQDDGPGIPEAEQGRIFDRFAQAGSPRERRGGTGLGLAIALEAARVHGGNLTVQSRTRAPGDRPEQAGPAGEDASHESGTTFTLTLPRAELTEEVTWGPLGHHDRQNDPQDDHPTARAELSSLAAPRAEGLQTTWPGPSPDSPLVVVIEDDDDLRTYVAETLSRKYRVQAAADGAEGLQLVRACRPDAVVCDVAMPRKDGYQVCQEVRADPDLKMTPILLLTARRHVDRIVEGFDAGASDYVMKPFHVRELMARLEAHLLVRYLLRATAHKERLASLGLLAAGVAHQVRNPLSALKNTVRAIERKVNAPGGVEPPRVAPDMFALVGECVTRIETFTRDLLDLSRVDSEQVGTFAPQTGIESVIRLMSTRLSAHVQLTCSVEPGMLMTGRAGDMNHVFMNLIDNALHAVGPRGAIDIRAAREPAGANQRDDDFIFEVGDSGPGIPPDKRDWVFEAFATTRSTDGTGLGLFLVRKIVFEHGGRVSVDQSPLGGALFRVRIPVKRPPASVGLTAGRSNLLAPPPG